jgi:hypothetical protein
MLQLHSRIRFTSGLYRGLTGVVQTFEANGDLLIALDCNLPRHAHHLPRVEPTSLGAGYCTADPREVEAISDDAPRHAEFMFALDALEPSTRQFLLFMSERFPDDPDYQF